jgi:hypothetical protein
MGLNKSTDGLFLHSKVVPLFVPLNEIFGSAICLTDGHSCCPAFPSV